MSLYRYQQFITEALVPSQYRKYVKAFNRERYETLFQASKEKYEGDKKAYRLFLPLQRTNNPVETEITTFLTAKGYEVLNYLEGTCKFLDAKNPTKIGKVLTKEKEDTLMKKFVEDPQRKSGADLLVCISRHPYDIAGSDTDRDWTNCMTIGASEHNPKVVKLLQELDKVDTKEKEIQAQIDKIYAKYPVKSKKAKVTNLKQITKQDQAAGQQLTQLLDELANIGSQKREVKEDLSDRKENGCNAKYIINEVQAGALISYLIKADDKNLQKPLAVLNIKPFTNKQDPADVLLVADKNMYGQGIPEFRATVCTWLDNEANLDKNGIFNQAQNTYHDSSVGEVVKLNQAALTRIEAEIRTQIKIQTYHNDSLGQMRYLPQATQKELWLEMAAGVTMENLTQVYDLLRNLQTSAGIKDDLPWRKEMVNKQTGANKLRMAMYIWSSNGVIDELGAEFVLAHAEELDINDKLLQSRNCDVKDLYHTLMRRKLLSQEQFNQIWPKFETLSRGRMSYFLFDAYDAGYLDVSELLKSENLAEDLLFELIYLLMRESGCHWHHQLVHPITPEIIKQIIAILKYAQDRHYRLRLMSRGPFGGGGCLLMPYGPPMMVPRELIQAVHEQDPELIRDGSNPHQGFGRHIRRGIEAPTKTRELELGEPTGDPGCPECGGQGSIPCPECNGGDDDCDLCRGENRVPCPECGDDSEWL